MDPNPQPTSLQRLQTSKWLQEWGASPFGSSHGATSSSSPRTAFTSHASPAPIPLTPTFWISQLVPRNSPRPRSPGATAPTATPRRPTNESESAPRTLVPIFERSLLRKRASSASERAGKATHCPQSGSGIPRATRPPTHTAPNPKNRRKNDAERVTSPTSNANPRIIQPDQLISFAIKTTVPRPSHNNDNHVLARERDG